jgi:hypothetical protein
MPRKTKKTVAKQSRLLSSDGFVPTELSGLRLGQKEKNR